MMLSGRQVCSGLVCSVLAVTGWMIASEMDRRQQKRAMKTELSRWEGEGGNVPDVETPSPEPQSAAR